MKYTHKKHRAFLEPTQSGVDSFYSLWIDRAKCDEDDKWYHRSIDFKISDCYQALTLNFGYRKESDRKAMLRKLNRLQDAMDLIREALDE